MSPFNHFEGAIIPKESRALLLNVYNYEYIESLIQLFHMLYIFEVCTKIYERFRMYILA